MALAEALPDEAWRAWNPGLDNDHLSLQEVYDSLPGADPECIHFLVRLLENPASPVALPGAASLKRHDCIQIALGRGLLGQDESFVIGYTMGTSKDIWDAQVWAFKKIARHLYPGIYRMSDGDLLAFDLGFGVGVMSRVRRIYDFPLEDHMAENLGALRHRIGIRKERLRAIYRHEQILLPHSVERRRLPVSPGERLPDEPVVTD